MELYTDGCSQGVGRWLVRSHMRRDRAFKSSCELDMSERTRAFESVCQCLLHARVAVSVSRSVCVSLLLFVFDRVSVTTV